MVRCNALLGGGLLGLERWHLADLLHTRGKGYHLRRSCGVSVRPRDAVCRTTLAKRDAAGHVAVLVVANAREVDSLERGKQLSGRSGVEANERLLDRIAVGRLGPAMNRAIAMHNDPAPSTCESTRAPARHECLVVPRQRGRGRPSKNDKCQQRSDQFHDFRAAAQRIGVQLQSTALTVSGAAQPLAARKVPHPN